MNRITIVAGSAVVLGGLITSLLNPSAVADVILLLAMIPPLYLIYRCTLFLITDEPPAERVYPMALDPDEIDEQAWD